MTRAAREDHAPMRGARGPAGDEGRLRGIITSAPGSAIYIVAPKCKLFANHRQEKSGVRARLERRGSPAAVTWSRGWLVRLRSGGRRRALAPGVEHGARDSGDPLLGSNDRPRRLADQHR